MRLLKSKGYMKSKAIILTLVCLPLYGYGQGHVIFDNFTGSPGPAPVTISAIPGKYNLANGPAGAYVGSDYTASLYYANGLTGGEAVFDLVGILYAPANTRFNGTTGFAPEHGPDADHAGLFDGQNVYITTALLQQVTVQVRVWYNGGGAYHSYDEALAAGQNVGKSNLVDVYLSLESMPPPYLNGLRPFTVGIPEPSTLALFGLGGLSFWLRRR
jgi:hypothetical protein